MFPSMIDPVTRVSNWLGVKVSHSSPILDPEDMEASEDDVDIFFTL